MKNILAIAVAAMAAVASQAATYTWNSGALTDSLGNIPAAGGITAYAFIMSDADDWEALTVNNVDLDQATKSVNSIVKGGKAQANLSNMTITGTQSSPSYVAIFYKDNTSGDIIGYKTTAYVNTAGQVNIADQIPDGVYTAAVNGGSTYGGGIYNASTHTVEPIPEPTSVALLALGLAALGLRRKVSK